MTLGLGVLLLTGESPESQRSGFIAANVGVLGRSATIDPVFQIDATLEANQWDAIVIDHLGQPAAEPGDVDRLHRQLGYKGLGHHFLIGNGNGLGDGVIHVGYRWNEQLPGIERLTESNGKPYKRAIGICLIGNGDRRQFTERQMAQLARLVRRLQQELKISHDQVYLHREVTPSVTSPGRLFPDARFQRRLITDVN